MLTKSPQRHVGTNSPPFTSEILRGSVLGSFITLIPELPRVKWTNYRDDEKAQPHPRRQVNLVIVGRLTRPCRNQGKEVCGWRLEIGRQAIVPVYGMRRATGTSRIRPTKDVGRCGSLAVSVDIRGHDVRMHFHIILSSLWNISMRTNTWLSSGNTLTRLRSEQGTCWGGSLSN